MNLYDELEARGLIHQVTDPALKDLLSQKSMTIYVGFDPTSDSLHIGNLLPLVTLRRFQKSGHRPIAVVGGATGMIGDPSGKSQERQLLDAETIDKNVTGISKVISRFVEFGNGDHDGILVNNLDWTKNLSIIDFLRETGKHFTVNYMLAKDSVKGRLEDREQGISYTEFSYMLLQAFDYYHLNQKFGCQVQLGGADQWGNITAGTELIRRVQAYHHRPAESVFGLTWPLITKADGTKFGKTESGAVWLTQDRTSAYEFYQFFLRTADQDVIRFLKFFTFLSLEEIAELETSLKTAPEKRTAQTVLAREMTLLVHGPEELEKVQKASQALFSGDLNDLDPSILKEIISNSPSNTETLERLAAGISLIDLLVDAKVSSSKSQARQDVQSGGIYVNNQRVTDLSFVVRETNLVHEKYLVLRKGKKNYHTVIFA